MSETFDVALGFEVMDEIKAHPDTHKQGAYRCDTGMCYAGWTAVIAGAQWVSNEPLVLHSNPAFGYVMNDDYYRVYVPEEDWPLFDKAFAREDADEFMDYTNTDTERYETRHIVPVWTYAQVKLGLDTWQAEAMFAGGNTREELDAMLLVLKDNPTASYGDLRDARRTVNPDDARNHPW